MPHRLRQQNEPLHRDAVRLLLLVLPKPAKLETRDREEVTRSRYRLFKNRSTYFFDIFLAFELKLTQI